MPKPIKHREFIRRFQQLGWEGPFSGGNHQFMVKGPLKVRMPNPHRNREIDWSLAQRILKQAAIDPQEFLEQKSMLRQTHNSHPNANTSRRSRKARRRTPPHAPTPLTCNLCPWVIP